ncbi:cytochrome P450 [Podospora australis]|uniref:Cytochrome P450 n=1 Tax=Podospora australis TaxID=1536484 RepID=A0AAN6WI20_9PEZI|nr:cytochrome P450 [Podospora australis]
MQRDVRTLALNILASIGLRKSYPFKAYQDPLAASPKSSEAVDEANTYRDSLQKVLDNCIALMIFPYRYLTLSWVPKSFQEIGKASLTFKQHMQKMIGDETETVRQTKTGSGGLMTGFFHALEVNKREVEAKVPFSEKKGLSLDEVFGNLFATDQLPADKWDYKVIYPQLKRCRAVMLETLRLFPPIMAILKWTKDTPQVLQIGEQVLQIPKDVGTVPSLYAIQTHPDYWPEPLRWLPKQWIENPAASPESVGDEKLMVPNKPIYFPWSAGPMACPGQKLSEVEFAATIAYLLKPHRLFAKQEPGETEQATLERVKRVTFDVNQEMLLRMQNADRVRVICSNDAVTCIQDLVSPSKCGIGTKI